MPRTPGKFILISAPAKINLYLGVHTETDDRGYHRVDSVMTTISLSDVVAIAPAEELSVHTVPAADYPMEQNSAYRAARAMGEAFGREPNFAILIDKHIPQQAGLGGPSTDAAATILGMVTYWGLDARDPRIDAVARRIGADVPFFLYGPPAYCDGAGDTVREMFRPLTGTPVALVRPQGPGVSTAEAYRRFDESPVALPPLEPLLEALRKHDETEIFANVANNLAPASCELHPAMAEALAWIGDQRDVRASAVAGSGSTVFAICNTQMAAEAIVLAARARGWWGEVAQMEKSGPYISVG
ncbi:4-(cytidine 5'-diphospho)-2-C-methyl-D-erythritol kinase [Collinsella intestinalis]|uniref:4-(cytidine 5'-diphospho)-2-C-methyl-D-erythritol kinase n=1 Tax=Collinsella intestinalis TaxID=147207 RepID=UPI00195CD2EC|nr:4-(cytidine 5'-diphospho)-2-C-methyl-D-erythritol kinase [Collinsella intestinalis]MBM6907692.1 4-(cytidine 5'-diphospho)-2-C-methyl-D-erythritol kinase [Collinsella intestinalis]